MEHLFKRALLTWFDQQNTAILIIVFRQRDFSRYPLNHFSPSTIGTPREQKPGLYLSPCCQPLEENYVKTHSQRSILDSFFITLANFIHSISTFFFLQKNLQYASPDLLFSWYITRKYPKNCIKINLKKYLQKIQQALYKASCWVWKQVYVYISGNQKIRRCIL